MEKLRKIGRTLEMSDCWAAPKRHAVSQTACASCGTKGRIVSDKTIQAILKPTQALSLLAVGRRFCGAPSCEVVYYGDDGRVVTKSEIRIRVGLKEREDPIPLCYCFNFNRADVRREVDQTGECTISARIAAAVRAGRCTCEVKNPSGGCCLGEVNKAVRDAKEARVRSRELAPSVRAAGSEG